MRASNGHHAGTDRGEILARKAATSAVISPWKWVAIIASAGFAVNVVVVWLIDGVSPGPYDLGQVVGIHLVAFLLTALVANVTRVGSIGTLVAIYLLAFAAIQVLLVLTDLA